MNAAPGRSQARSHRSPQGEGNSVNTRALALYASEGFVEEGRLRESVRISTDTADGYDSLVVMSMLDREYQARVALGLETIA